MVITKQATAAIEQAVRDGLQEDRELAGKEIEVQVSGDQVLLQGTVESLAELNRAGRIAAGVREVSQVDNRLEIDPSRQKDGKSILAEIKRELQQRPALGRLRINVSVNRGRITLAGTVENLQQKLEVHEIACRSRGAGSILNLLETPGAENESGGENSLEQGRLSSRSLSK